MRILDPITVTSTSTTKGAGRKVAEQLPDELVTVVEASYADNSNTDSSEEKKYQVVEFDSYDEATKYQRVLKAHVKRTYDGYGVDTETYAPDGSRIVKPTGDAADGWNAPQGAVQLRFRVRPTRQYARKTEGGDATTAQSADGMGHDTPAGDADVVSSVPNESHIEFSPNSQA